MSARRVVRILEVARTIAASGSSEILISRNSDETKGAAERRQNKATAEGRGFRLGKTKPRQGRLAGAIFQARLPMRTQPVSHQSCSQYLRFNWFCRPVEIARLFS
ncbi:MAG: hypothetical protein DMG13_07685 [Acidobacteria bacterium]|nr:MAG: hypothetical protein DMG13_07685 [Acidobacteriota bacterium]